ncbi:bacteriohemerythrin [mine drainage metagenome]|uniref:Bacteriohemerythrin n=1 Tax=mine drainage metagenome TaxID=410659 RepID=A0A1J5RN08_9ZZZZ
MPIVWRDAMAIGAAELDADHKKLVSLLNASEKAVGEQALEVGARLFELVADYAQTHFQREEVFMLSSGFSGYERHKRLHQAMTDEARQLWRAYLSAGEGPARLPHLAALRDMLRRWLAEHVLGEDLQLKALTGKRMRIAVAPGAAPVAPREVLSRQVEVQKTTDVVYDLPPELAHLLRPFSCEVPELPPPEGGFTCFEDLCRAAIRHRIERVLVFFQRGNPQVRRALPPPFLASAEFAGKFHAAVAQLILPTIVSSRQIKMMSTNIDCAGLDTDNFWDMLTPILKEHILACWRSAWDDLRLLPGKKPDGTRIWQVKEETRTLRALLEPSDAAAYDLPRIGNREIDLFTSLLDTVTDWWGQLNRCWDIVEDIYEQEKDPRIFQDKARAGALRDNLLAAFEKFPEQWGDFLVLACHRMFPRISSLFLERFTHNVGHNEAERELHLPYTVRYLRQVRGHPGIRAEEERQEADWQAEMEQLRLYLKGRNGAS